MKKTFLFSCFLIAFTSNYLNAQFINIPADYPTIQQGIDASQNGDTILVQPGTYVEQIRYNGKNIILGSLYLITGNEEYIEQTIIDGDAYGLPCVRFVDGETTDAQLIGFTIQNGWTASDEFAGGVHFIASSATLDHLIIRNNNSQSGRPGGIFLYFSPNTIIKNTSFINNTCNNTGGGIFAHASSPIIINCVFTGNNSPSGSAVYFQSSAAILINCLAYGNYGNQTMLIDNENLLINNTICNNFTPVGLYVNSGDPRMINIIPPKIRTVS